MHYYLSRKLSGKYKCKTLSRSRGQNQITNATQEINCQEVSCDIYKHHWNLLFITSKWCMYQCLSCEDTYSAVGSDWCMMWHGSRVWDPCAPEHEG